MKTIIITGATGAIGNAAAHALAQRGDVHLLLTGRDEDKLDAIRHDLDGYENVIADTMTMDLSDIISVNLGLEKIKAGYPKIDAIVNCAAIYKGEQALSRHGYELMFATNHLGPFQLTTGLMTQLKAAHGSRVIMVTAPSTSSINFDNIPNPKKYSAFGQFGVTKMMNLLFAFSLADLFKGTGHAAIAFHPGLIKSDIMSEGPILIKGLFRMLSTTPEKTSETLASLVLDGESTALNGKFYNKMMKQLTPHSNALDESVQQKLWEKSEKLLQVPQQI